MADRIGYRTVRDDKGNLLSLLVSLRFDDGRGGFVTERHIHPRKEVFDLRRGKAQGKKDESIKTLIDAGILPEANGEISVKNLVVFEKSHLAAERAASARLRAKPPVVSEEVMLDDA